MNLDILLFKITLLFYLVATILYLVDVITRHGKVAKFARWILVAGFWPPLRHPGGPVCRSRIYAGRESS